MVIKSKLAWIDFFSEPLCPTSKDGLDSFLSLTGIDFPDDLKELILLHGGQIPSQDIIESDIIHPIQFGPIYHLRKAEDEFVCRFNIENRWNKWKDSYPNLVPFAASGNSSNFFALDLSNSTNGNIVFIDTEYDPDDSESKIHLFDNISLLINNLKT